MRTKIQENINDNKYVLYHTAKKALSTLQDLVVVNDYEYYPVIEELEDVIHDIETT